MDPVTVMTCIQVASSVAGMLAPKGPGIGDLLKIQTEMLKNISKQIEVLQNGINQVITDIDKLKQFVEYKLPSEIYKTFVTNDLLAEFNSYDKNIFAYLFDRQDLGILEAYDKNKTKLLDQLNSIQKISSRLFLHRDFFLAPLIARCFKIEMDLNIILYGKDLTKGQFQASFMGYENWLKNLLDIDRPESVEKNIDELKKRIDTSIDKTYGYNLYKISERNENIEGNHNLHWFVYNYIKIHFNYFEFKTILNPDIKNVMNSINFSLEELFEIYAVLNISDKYLPSKLSPTVDRKSSEEEKELKFIDEFIFTEGLEPSPRIFQISKGTYSDDRYDITRDDVKDFVNKSDQILILKNYFEDEKLFTENGMKILVPIAHKKIMVDVQNKINFLKSRI